MHFDLKGTNLYNAIKLKLIRLIADKNQEKVAKAIEHSENKITTYIENEVGPGVL